MASRNATLNDLSTFDALKNAYESFNLKLDESLPLGNDLRVYFPPTGNSVSRDFTVMGYACRLRFSIARTAENHIVGRLFFERVISATDTQRFFTLHFDEHLNAVVVGEDSAKAFSLKEPLDLRQRLGTMLVQAMLDSLIAER